MRKAAKATQASLLRKSILQAAVEGKLVPQDPRDEPASELLARIKAEKAQLIKEGKLKKEKPLPSIAEDEKPFALPKGWEWVSLGEIAFKITDGAHQTPTYTFSGVPFLSVKDMSSGKLNFSSTKYISEKEHRELYKRCNPEKGDLLVTKVGTTGIPVIVDTDKEFSLFVSVALVKANWNLSYIKYLSCAIQSPLVAQQAQENTRGVGNKNWVLRDIINTSFPLPPLAEQKRIVAKVDKLMHHCDQLEKAEQAATALDAHFFETLPKSILQAAVQGKLVPQDENDESASVLLERIKKEKAQLIKNGKLKKEKPLLAIEEEEKPFDLPKGWEWCRLNDVCSYIQRGKSPKYSDTKKIPVIAQKCNQWTGFSIEKAKFIDPVTFPSYAEERILQEKDLLWNSTGLGTLGRIVLYKEELNPYKVAVADSHVTVIRPLKNYILPDFLLAYFSSPWVQSEIESKSDGSTKQKELATATVKNYVVPVPPLDEQIRIVQKISELSFYCNELHSQTKE